LATPAEELSAEYLEQLRRDIRELIARKRAISTCNDGNLTNSVGYTTLSPMTTGTSSMGTTSIHVTLPQALKDHIEKRVAEGEFTSPSDYVRALVRAERAYQDKRAALIRDIDAGLADLEAGRVHDGEAVFAELLGEEEPQP
jgi:putative addiction module CopG family antidote